jgi:hypothetical protein
VYGEYSTDWWVGKVVFNRRDYGKPWKTPLTISHDPTKVRILHYLNTSICSYGTPTVSSHLHYGWGDLIRYQTGSWFFFLQRKETIIQLVKLHVYFCGIPYDAMIISNCTASECETTDGRISKYLESSGHYVFHYCYCYCLVYSMLISLMILIYVIVVVIIFVVVTILTLYSLCVVCPLLFV